MDRGCLEREEGRVANAEREFVGRVRVKPWAGASRAKCLKTRPKFGGTRLLTWRCARAQFNKSLDHNVDFVLIAYVILGQRVAIQLNANCQ